MIRKPNEYNYVSFSDESKRKNQIGRKFSDIFDVFTNPNYYEGTKYAEFFDKITGGGKSALHGNFGDVKLGGHQHFLGGTDALGVYVVREIFARGALENT